MDVFIVFHPSVCDLHHSLFSIMSHSSILMDLKLLHLLLQLCLIVRSDQYFLSMVPTFPRWHRNILMCINESYKGVISRFLIMLYIHTVGKNRPNFSKSDLIWSKFDLVKVWTFTPQSSMKSCNMDQILGDVFPSLMILSIWLKFYSYQASVGEKVISFLYSNLSTYNPSQIISISMRMRKSHGPDRYEIGCRLVKYQFYIEHFYITFDWKVLDMFWAANLQK